VSDDVPGSYCTVACCLKHRKRVFVQLWPPRMAYWWYHSAGMTRCDALPAPEDPAAVLVPVGEGGPGWVLPSLWQLDYPYEGKPRHLEE
jgi:hypothetical protein